ncbi:MAG TPA: hypothetical protein VEX86_20805, partial [Longimicrobium sp.]|nr:hypothetical protein [Longimicrobium sp.]
PAAQESRVTAIGVGPALKLYTADAGDLRPYVFASAGVTFVRNRSESPDQGGGTSVSEGDGTSMNAALGLGLQWSPIPRVSIGGHAGIEANRGEGTTQFGAGGQIDVDGHAIGTFTSGLRLHFYF